ncbi:MAG: hypothetical protein K6T78_09720 [Alicyclobacillus sp.]|nr:hypothetical protein [Alicyclobacillus sp.]
MTPLSPSFRVFGAVYLMLVALLITALLGGKATHPGMVLGLAAIVLGLLLLGRAMAARNQMSALLCAGICVLVEIVACFIVGFATDPTELWFATFYGVFGVLLGLEGVLKRVYETTRRSGW